jgi:transcriptional regulator with XRE-family HTH domain
VARTLGNELKKVRQLRGLSLNAVARPAGLSAAYLQKLERGNVESPSPHRLHKLAEVLDLEYVDLFRLAGYPVPGAGEETVNAAEDGGFAQTDLASGDASLLRKAFQSEEQVSDEELEQLAHYLAFLRQERERA